MKHDLTCYGVKHAALDVTHVDICTYSVEVAVIDVLHMIFQLCCYQQHAHSILQVPLGVVHVFFLTTFSWLNAQTSARVLRHVATVNVFANEEY